MPSALVDHRSLAGRFNARGGRDLGVQLVGGADEPLYLPPRPGRPAWIRYARDHASSVLHELAHWCLATPAARGQVDYGLVYRPPPRSPRAQQRFYQAELPVQALEKLLCEACGLAFEVSDDNPGRDDPAARSAFARRVDEACEALRLHGPGGDAVRVLDTLAPDWRRRVGAGRVLERCA